MAWGDIPQAALAELASERVRMYHALWHFVRREANWNGLDEATRQDLTARGWQAPRFEDADGGGIDFLYMHRRMIEMVNFWAAGPGHGNHGNSHGHGAQPFVQGWREIPWDHQDPVWPMPVVDLTSDPTFPEIFGDSKESGITEQYQRRVAERFANRAWLRSRTLDQFGTELEFTIHGWMHMHWSTEPPANPNTLDEGNDWLGSPFSSHVNRHFWKLHGWIDDRIHAWEDAHGEKADMSGGWEGPPDELSGEMHKASPEFFDLLRFNERPPLLMPWKDLLLERS